MSEPELAFYDALETNDGAVQGLGDETPRAIAKELIDSARKNVTVDWTVQETARAKPRVMGKRVPKKHGFRPRGSLGYRPPAPEAIVPLAVGSGATPLRLQPGVAGPT